MIETIDNTVFFKDDVLFDDIASDIVTFFSNDIDPNSTNLNKISLDDDNCEDSDPKTMNHVRLMAWYDRYKSFKTCKK